MLYTNDDLDRNTYQEPSRKARVSPFMIDCVRLSFDGEVFVHCVFEIDEFQEEKNIIDLEVYPLDFAKDKQVLMKTLLSRGQQFAAFREYKHQNYTGLSLSDPPEEVRSIDGHTCILYLTDRFHTRRLRVRSS